VRTTVAEIAARLGGTVEGDGTVVIRGVAGVGDAGEGEISFVANPRYAPLARTTGASALLVGRDWAEPASAALIRVDNPSLAFAEVVSWVAPPPVRFEPGVHETAVVSPAAELGSGVSVQPCTVVEPGAKVGARTVLMAGVYVGHESVIGEDCVIHPQVTIRERVRIGDRVVLHAGSVVGSDGFGYETVDGVHRKIPQVGSVRIDDDVEIGAGTTVDRARFGATWIQKGVKIDNLVQIAHNVVVEEGALIVAQVGIAGSSRVERGAIVAGQAGISGHVTVGAGAIVGGQGGVSKDVPPGAYVFGCPAEPMKSFSRHRALVHRLPRLIERLEALEDQVARLRKARSARG
jgi:UDP-3-O-[3-hydroxymyristoyl] glucosamine N-acyltransferase